jgi:hypothetical protein
LDWILRGRFHMGTWAPFKLVTRDDSGCDSSLKSSQYVNG